jgi:hypothetical protein
MKTPDMHPLLPPSHTPAPATNNLARTLIGVAAGVLVCICLIWVLSFICICLLLARANTPEVHATCAGFWDGMLFATLAPTIVPLVYCLLAPCLWLAWRPFSAGCALVLCVVTLHLSLTAAEQPLCVDALRQSSPPLPLLLFAGFIKSGLFAAGALTILRGDAVHETQHQQQQTHS